MSTSLGTRIGSRTVDGGTMSVVPLNSSGRPIPDEDACAVEGFCSVLKGRHPTMGESYQKLFGESKSCCGKCKAGTQCSPGCTCTGNMNGRTAATLPGGFGRGFGPNWGGGFAGPMGGGDQGFEQWSLSQGKQGGAGKGGKTFTTSIVFKGKDKDKNRKTYNGELNPEKGSWPNSTNAKKGGLKGGFGKRIPGSRYVSIKTEKKKCKATIFIHVTLDVTAASAQDCGDKHVQDFIETVEAGLENHWKDSKCKCATGKFGKGCTFSVQAVWHEEAKGDVISLKLDCKTMGRATVGKSIEFKSGLTGGTPTPRPFAAAVIVHELSHQLFGAEKNAPYFDDEDKNKAWDKSGHNPDNKGFMRDTKVKGGGLKPEDKPTQMEVCFLVDKYDLCDMKACCNEKAPKVPPKRGKKKKNPEIPIPILIVHQLLSSIF